MSRSPARISLVLGLLALVTGCAGDVPTSVVLTIDGYFPAAGQLLLTVYDPEGVVMRDRRIPSDPNAAISLPATLVLFPGSDRSPIRVLLRVREGGVIGGEGTATIQLKPERQVGASLSLIKGRLPDQDQDDVPDDVDNCKELANPEQEPCSAPDAMPDLWSDAGPVLDTLTDAPGDLPHDVGQDRSVDAPPDAPSPDAPPVVPPDAAIDLAPDLKPDTFVYNPLSASALSSALQGVKVDCVLATGAKTGAKISIVDTPGVKFFNGTVTLAGAPADTKVWVGSKSSVTIVWDPNACDYEIDVTNIDWSSAGLLVRGATLSSKGELMLEPTVTVNDIDMIDVNPDGTFQMGFDHFKPDDSGLSSSPQLVLPVTAAKQTVLKTASP